MALNEPKDTRQMQSLTATTGQPQDLRNQTDRQPGAMPNLPSVPMATPGGTGGRGAAAGFRSKVLEARQARKAQQAAAAPVEPGAGLAETPSEISAQAPAAETGDVTPEAGLTAPPAQEPVPAGPQMGDMVTTGVSTTREIADPELKKAVIAAEEAGARKLEADTVLAETQQKQAQAEAAIKAEQARKQAAEADLLQQRMEENRLAQQQAMDRYNQEFDKYASMGIQNPWSRTSTGTKIMAGLSIMLGGLSGPGGAEAARQSIDEALNKDIELQKASMDKKKGELTMLQQHAKDLRAMGMDDVNITKSMQALAKDAYSRQLESLAAQTAASDPAKASLLAGLAQEQKLKAVDLRKTAEESTKVITNKSPLMPSAEKGEMMTQKDRDILAGRRQGLRAFKQIKDLMKQEEYNSKVGPIAGRLSKMKAVWLGDAEASVLQSRTDRALLQALREATGAQMTDAERQFIAQTMPSFFENPESFMAKLDDLIGQTQTNYNEQLQTLGAQGFNTRGFDPVEMYQPESAKKRD